MQSALWALLAVPALAAFLVYAAGRRRQALDRFGDADLVARLSQTVNHRGRRAKSALLLAAVGAMAVALARPQFGTRVDTVRREGQDIIVALDLSVSMLAEDIVPNRLERAKLAVSRLIDRLEGDRIGLVAFAGAGRDDARLRYVAARRQTDVELALVHDDLHAVADLLVIDVDDRQLQGIDLADHRQTDGAAGKILEGIKKAQDGGDGHQDQE